MDEINDFFDFSKEFKRVQAPRGFISSNIQACAGPLTESKPIKREQIGNDYALEIAKKEQDSMMVVDAACSSTHFGGQSSMDDLEDLSDQDSEDDVKPRVNKINEWIYNKYPFNDRRDETLPIHDFKEEILETIRKNHVTVLEGDTGCGKTTQVPQYILDDGFRRQEYCKIVCTQPRRIAAMSIAKRVSQERKWELGTVVGYQVGLHAVLSEDTRLMYCTTGVLLQKLIKEKTLTSYTHIILDEVHERDQDMDFLLIVIRRLLSTNSRNVKIILMSATINTGEFAKYFKIRNNPAPIIRVNSRRLYEVRDFYLCDLDRINKTNTQVNFEDPNITSELFAVALKLVIVVDNIEKQEVSINTHNINASILIFLPGINEIDIMATKLHELTDSDDNLVKLMPIRLHSMIAPDEQSKIFIAAPRGFRKVILATNIAESSITVPDVKYVIDFCLTKSLVTDTATNFTSLQLNWASRANCRQRAGRAGRLMNGRVYRLVPKYFYDVYLKEFGIPEMLRCPLENVVLKAKLLEMGPPPDILGLAMDPPNLSDIQNTILTLKEVGALYTRVDKTYSLQDGDLTFMGRVMAGLPLDIRLGRLIILGYVFSALEDTIIIAAGLSVRSIFQYQKARKKQEAEAFIQKLLWADGSGSDLVAILRAYKVWASMREQYNMNVEESEKAWADRFFINLRSIREMHLLVLELKERLIHFGLKEQTAYQRVQWMSRERNIILKVIIAGAFYPNYFTRSNLNAPERQRDTYHILCGHDPCSTVFFTNFNTRHIGQLYTQPIKELFKDVRIQPKNIEVRFQTGSERIFVTFKNHPEDETEDNASNLVVPGRVRPEIYKALRMRSLNIRPTLRVMDPKLAIKYAERQGLGVMVEGAWEPTRKQIRNPELVVLPSIFNKNMRGYITHIESCGKFFFQPLSEMERLREINSLLNDPIDLETCKFRSAGEISVGMQLSAPFDDKYHRGRVMKVITTTRQHVRFKIYFIDYGNVDIIDFEHLRRFSFKCESLVDLPPRVFECRLAMVQPSTVKSPSGKWPDEAMEQMQTTADSGMVEIEVYSVVASVANVFLKLGNETLNDTLVDFGLARQSDENYLSKADHDYRMRKQSVANRFLDEDHCKQNEEYLRSIQVETDVYTKPPPLDQCTKMIQLRGPFSPLETTVYAAVRMGTWKTVQIERESVNWILLDTDPQDAHDRLIVAASITEAQAAETLTARATTLMPNIHGFSALMTMIFCPTLQLKCNANRTKYVTVLAGLGYDEKTYQPLYEEHDIVLSLDVDILNDDIELINQLRYSMDTMLYTDPGDERPQVVPASLADLHAKVKNIIIRLLNKNRKYIETHIDNNDYKWENISNVVETKQLYGTRTIFPLHSVPRLYDEKFDRMHALAVHCAELHRLGQFDGSIQPITCQLCKQPLENIVQLRIHLLSQLHRDREKQIRFKLPTN